MSINQSRVIILLALLSARPAQAQSPVIVFRENFENGAGAWRIDNGVWEIGQATFSVRDPSSGNNVAGTILSGRSPGNASTRLISPPIVLPSILNPGERLQLRFWQWSYANSREAGVIEVSTDGQSNWQPVSKNVIGNSRLWTQYIAGLTKFAGTRIYLAFHFTASSGLFPGLGWYIDDVSVEVSRGAQSLIEDFEAGPGDWYADRGVWEIGPPVYGTATAPSGRNVAGTVLRGRSPTTVDSRLISPPVTLPQLLQGERIYLSFFHWSYAAAAEEGIIEIMESNGPCGAAHMITQSLIGSSRQWVRHIADVTDFAGATIRVAFRFHSDETLFPGAGWYIDRFELATVRAKAVTGLRIEPATVKIGSAYTALFSGTDLNNSTYFDVRFRRPGSTQDETALNWQQGVSMSHAVTTGTRTGSWIVTGIRAHDDRDNHSGDFLTVSTALTVAQ